MNKQLMGAALASVLAIAGVAAAQTSPAALGVNLHASGSAQIGAQDTLLALLTFSAVNSSSTVQFSSVPLDVSFGNGVVEGMITDCRVRNLTNLLAPLNNGGNAVGIVQGSNTIPLDSPFVVATGTAATLAFTCDVANTALSGGTIALSLPTNRVSASAAGNASSVSVSTGTVNGTIGPTSGVVTVTNAAAPRVPGVPNTGSDAMQNLFLLVVAGLVAAGGFFLARRMMANI